MAPDGVMRPILLPPYSANHRFPSGPATMPSGSAKAVAMGNSVTVLPEGVIRAILPTPYSVNHTFPSGPAAMPSVLEEVGGGRSSTSGAGRGRPLLSPSPSVH